MVEKRGEGHDVTIDAPGQRHPAPYDLLIPLDLLRMASSMTSRVVYASAV